MTPIISLNNTQPKKQLPSQTSASASVAVASSQTADGFSLEKFEYFAYSRQSEKSAQQLIRLLQALERGYGNPNIALARGPNNSIADNDVAQHLTSRFAGAITAMFTDPNFKLSKEGFKTLVFFQRWISHIFGGSHYRNADHIIRAINVEDQTTGKVEVKTEDILKLLLLWVPESEIQLNYDDFWRFDKILAANAFLSMLTPRFLGSPAAHQRREFLLQWLPEKLGEIDDLEQLNAGNLLDVYWNTSYSNLKTKHHIKRPINYLIRKKIVQWGIQDILNTPLPSDGTKPKIFIIVGKYFCHNVVYRTLRKILEGCLTDFHIIGIMPGKSVDATSAKGFNEIIDLPDKPLVEQLKFIVNLAQERRPQIILYPSVGEIFLTLFGINMRLAPTQIASIGATGSTESKFIDYFLLEENQVKDEGYFSEKLLRIPRSANPMTLPPSFNEVEPIYRENPDVVDVSVIMTANKINPDFLLTLKEIAKRSKSKVKYVMSGSLFLPGPVKEHIDHVMNFYLGDLAEVLPPIDYLKYIERLRNADLFLLSFPFTGLNTIVDYFCVGLLGVASGFGNDLAETFGEAYFKAVDVPDWTIAKSREDYINAAVRLIDNHAERIALRKQFVASKPHHRLCDGDALFLNNKLLALVHERAKNPPTQIAESLFPPAKFNDNSQNRIYYIDSVEPTAGGQIVNWRHLEFLRNLGYNAGLAAINEQQIGRVPPFLAIPITGLGKIIPNLKKDDIVVIPEIYKQVFDILKNTDCVKIIHNQNPYYTFQAWQSVQDLDKYGFKFGITCGEYPKKILQEFGSKLDWQVITPYCDEKAFISEGKIITKEIFKEKIQNRPLRIGYIARKRPHDHYAIVGIFKSLYPEHAQIEWVDFSQFKGDEYTNQLRNISIWANFSFNEATPMPPLMAMATGCLVAGFHGHGGLGYMDESNGFWVEEGDYQGFAQALHQAIALQGDEKSYLAKIKNGFETALKFKKSRFETELQQVWQNILGDKADNFKLKSETPSPFTPTPILNSSKIAPNSPVMKFNLNANKSNDQSLPSCRIFSAYYFNPQFIFNTEIIKPILVDKCFEKFDGIEYLENSGKNIANKSKYYHCASVFYWIYHNQCNYDYIGFHDYRRFFNFTSQQFQFAYNKENMGNLFESHGLQDNNIRQTIANYDIILPKLATIGISIYDQLKNATPIEPLDVSRDIIAKIHPDYLTDFDNVMQGNQIYWWNMFIAKQAIFKEWFEWIYPIIQAVDKKIKIANNPKYQGFDMGAIGYLTERLWMVFVHHHLKDWKIHEVGFSQINVHSPKDDLKKR